MPWMKLSTQRIFHMFFSPGRGHAVSMTSFQFTFVIVPQNS